MKKLGFIFTLTFFIIFNSFAVYQNLEVEGIKVHITNIRFDQGYEDSVTMGEISLDKTVDLTGDPSDVLTEGFSLSLSMGVDQLQFDTINIQMEGGVSIKGHTFIEAESKHIYTTVAGVGEYSSANPVFTIPSDYDYHHIDYFYDPSRGEDENETTFLTQSLTIPEGEAPVINLLVDTFKVAYYWDGDDNTRHGFVKTMPYHNPEVFPSGTAVFGVTYIPFYVSVNQNVVRETYVLAASETDLDVIGESYDVKRVMYMTLLFDEETDDFYQGRTANWDGLDVSLDFPQFVNSGTESGGEYSLIFRNFDDNLGWNEDTTITGFSRLSVDAVDNALNGTSTFYYKRVE